MQWDAEEITLPVVPRSRDLESGGSPLPSLLFIAFRLPSPGLLPAHPVEAGGGGLLNAEGGHCSLCCGEAENLGLN